MSKSHILLDSDYLSEVLKKTCEEYFVAPGFLAKPWWTIGSLDAHLVVFWIEVADWWTNN